MKLETMEAKVNREGIDGSNLQYQLGNKIYMRGSGMFVQIIKFKVKTCKMAQSTLQRAILYGQINTFHIIGLFV